MQSRLLVMIVGITGALVWLFAGYLMADQMARHDIIAAVDHRAEPHLTRQYPRLSFSHGLAVCYALDGDVGYEELQFSQVHWYLFPWREVLVTK